jgi:hypothetical protein
MRDAWNTTLQRELAPDDGDPAAQLIGVVRAAGRDVGTPATAAATLGTPAVITAVSPAKGDALNASARRSARGQAGGAADTMKASRASE